MRRKLYVFGAPGKLGGAATKIRDILRMLRSEFDIVSVLGDVSFQRDVEMMRFLDNLSIRSCLRKELPSTMDGIALGICEVDFFSSGLARRLKSAGLKVVWSNEMMWEFKGEAEAVTDGQVDRVLFLSEIQRDAFLHIYAGADQVIIRNHITPEGFPYTERSNPTFTIGRLSRPDPVKFPMDFPVFYEELGLDDVKFRIQAWNKDMEKKFSWHRFDSRWEFFKPNKIPAARFLQGLDLFLYPLGHEFVESWGRVVAEAMLTGCVPVVPSGHQFHNIFHHGEHGFICSHFDEYKTVVHELHDHASLRREMGRKAAEYARYDLFDHEKHRQMWIDALTFD